MHVDMQIHMYPRTHTHPYERERLPSFFLEDTQFKHKFWQNIFITNLVKKAQRLHILLTENWM